mmetsp:Transcript_22504/g.40612  ORF Transcript_22504/g.40612 Transcript_22504/m.40612 type:complete len:147 (+) Transcript_22504:100-540(+)
MKRASLPALLARIFLLSHDDGGERTCMARETKNLVFCLLFYFNACSYEIPGHDHWFLPFNRLTVKAVVVLVNDVVGRRGPDGEAALVLLDDLLFLSAKSGDVVDVGDGFEGSGSDNLSSNGWVHTGHLEVDTHVGVVHIDDSATTE